MVFRVSTCFPYSQTFCMIYHNKFYSGNELWANHFVISVRLLTTMAKTPKREPVRQTDRENFSFCFYFGVPICCTSSRFLSFRCCAEITVIPTVLRVRALMWRCHSCLVVTPLDELEPRSAFEMHKLNSSRYALKFSEEELCSWTLLERGVD